VASGYKFIKREAGVEEMTGVLERTVNTSERTDDQSSSAFIPNSSENEVYIIS
jgi:hypothetical protein